MKSLVEFISLLPLIIVLFQCSQGRSQRDIQALPKIQVTFENQSQFDVEALFIHDAVDNYAAQPNRLTTTLSIGKALQFEIPETTWYVTVYRKPNKDSDVLAYTTAEAWNPQKYPKLIYFDEQFRSQK